MLRNVNRQRLVSHIREFVAKGFQFQKKCLLVTCGVAWCATAYGDVITWNGSATGTWNTTATNWNTGLTNPWDATNGPSNSSIFNTASLNATVSGSVYTNGITFSTAGTLGGSGIINFVGTSPTVTNAVAATINAPIAGTFTKTGAGQLNIGALNSGANVTVNQGTLNLGASGVVQGVIQVNSGATLTNSAVHVFARTTDRLFINGGTLQSGPEFYLPYGTSAADPGIQMTGGLISGNDLRFDAGTNAQIRINAASTTATISATIRHNQNGTQTYNVVGGTVPSGIDLLISGNISGAFNVNNKNNVTKTGAGLMEVTGTLGLANNGDFTVTQGTARLTGANAITNFGSTSSSIILDATNSVTLQFNAANAADSLTFSKKIAGGNSNAVVQKIGPGTVILTPAASSTFVGAIQATAGNLYLNNANFTTAPTVSIANNATFGGTGTAGNISVSNGGILEGGQGGSGTLTAANVTLGNSPSDTVTLKGTLSTTAGYKPLAVTNLTINGGDQSVLLNAAGVGLTSGSYYDLLVSTNNITAPNTTGASVLAALKSNARAYTPNVDITGKKIQLYYDSNASIYWTGATSTAWNTSATNFKLSGNNSDTQFLANDVVYFNDSPTNSTVDISGANVSPIATFFTNTTATAYTLQGSNGIATGSITKSGNGTLTITNANTTTGAVTLNDGVVNMSQTGGLGTGAVTFGGGTLNYTGATSGTWAPTSVTLNSGVQTIGVTNAAATLSYGGPVGGAGSLTKTGAGTLTLSGTNTYSGATTVEGGKLNLTSAINSASNVTIGSNGSTGATLVLVPTQTLASLTTAPNSTGNTVTLNTATTTSYYITGFTTLNSALTFVKPSNGGSWADLNFNGGITGGAGAGNDSLIFSNLGGIQMYIEGFAGKTYNYTGNTHFLTSNGAEYVFQQSSFLSAQSNVILDAGSLVRNNTGGTYAFGALSGSGNWNANGTAVIVSLGNNGDSGTYSGVLSSTASVIKNGTGVQTLTGANTYTGTTTINSGTLSANKIAVSGGNSSLGNATSAVVLGDATNQGTLSYTGGTATYTRGLTVNAGGGQLTNAGSGLLTVSTGGITAGGQFTVGGAAGKDITIDSVISSTGGFTKTGADTVILTNANTYAGTTSVTGGQLIITGSIVNNGPAAVLMDTNNSPKLTRHVTSGTDYATAYATGLGSTALSNDPNVLNTTMNTTAAIIGGTTTGDSDISMQWRARGADESLPSNTNAVLSNVLDLSGVYDTGTTGDGILDQFVLQMSYTNNALGSLNEEAIALSGELRLGWLDNGVWKSAFLGNDNGTGTGIFVGAVAYDPNNPEHNVLGAYGVDYSSPNGGVVWAVLNHNSEFAVIPEPSTFVVGGLALLGFAGIDLRRRRQRTQ